MGNWSGLLIIGVAGVLVLMGIQGSWQKFFPWMMSSSGSSIPYAGGQAPPPVSGPDTQAPGSGNSCPSGYIYFPSDNMCHKLIPIAN